MSGSDYAQMTTSMIPFWVLVIAGVVAAARYAARPGVRGTQGGSTTPEEVLAGRFARGEIDEHEYRDRLEILRGDAALTPGRHGD